ncbi:MAG: hypothetical protein QG617_1305 [Campylobacterota bacterium]|nr:hypothetical protein [Campylobacterota bacterium]
MKNMKIGSVIVASVILMSGCSQKADSIKATYASPLPYEKHSCKQLKDEVIRVNKRLSEISGQQADVANKDAVVMGVGLVIFWPALLLMAQGEDQKAEIGNLKGQYNTLRDVAVKKNCDFAASMR